MNPKIAQYYVSDVCLCGEAFRDRGDYNLHTPDCKVMQSYRGEMSHSYVNDSKVLEKLANDAKAAVEERDLLIQKLQNDIKELKKK